MGLWWGMSRVGKGGCLGGLAVWRLLWRREGKRVNTPEYATCDSFLGEFSEVLWWKLNCLWSKTICLSDCVFIGLVDTYVLVIGPLRVGML